MIRWLQRVVTGPWILVFLASVILTAGVAQMVAGALVTGLADATVALVIYCFTLVRGFLLRTGIRIGHEIGVAHGQAQAREAMYASMREAQARGMSPIEWLETELERDRGGNEGDAGRG